MNKKTDSFEKQIVELHSDNFMHGMLKSHWYKTYQIGALLFEYSIVAIDNWFESKKKMCTQSIMLKELYKKDEVHMRIRYKSHNKYAFQ